VDDPRSGRQLEAFFDQQPQRTPERFVRPLGFYKEGLGVVRPAGDP
jgi:hypothetical protein